ncbi:DEAD/DEAH box helicase family protein, partial [Escherichia fergusonii]
MAKKPTSAGSEKLLFNKLKQFDEPGLFHDNYQTPDYIQANLKDALRPYQHGALRYLHYTQRKREEALLHYRHLLFHMATGAGKTMVMAGTILYLFKEYGYQNFIFFVHTDAIIQKTRENLLNPQSPKYLFSQELEIDGEKITIAPVETFPSVPERNTRHCCKVSD